MRSIQGGCPYPQQELTPTLAKLTKESHFREEAEKAKTNLTTEVAALQEQMDKAKAGAVAEFGFLNPSLMHAVPIMAMGSMTA